MAGSYGSPKPSLSNAFPALEIAPFLSGMIALHILVYSDLYFLASLVDSRRSALIVACRHILITPVMSLCLQSTNLLARSLYCRPPFSPALDGA